ncbi:MAG TPA: C25 family cysteine peptidase [Terriglobales bacterium]|nr:C25 family cysteine peptidase [Terriglobales bacterium]
MTAWPGESVTVDGFRTLPARVLDLTDPARPSELLGATAGSAGDYQVSFSVPGGPAARHTLLVVAQDGISQAPGLVSNQPSHWHAAQPGADMIILTHPAFVSQLAPLVRLRRAQGLKVAVVLTDDVYDEFNFGERSPQAVRDLLASALANWSVKPRYLLLVGDASIDPRDFLGLGNFDFVPTRLLATQELMTASDDWFSDFNDQGLPQISTGRLPVRTPQDAALLIGKIVAYDASPAPGPWKNQALLIADRDDTENFTSDSQAVQALLPSGLAATLLPTSALDPATARQQVQAALAGGQLLVNYIGHGSVEVWSEQDLLDGASASALANGPRLPVVFSVECLNGFYQDVFTQSLAESLLLAPQGGAVAVVASSGLLEPGPQVQLDQKLVGTLFANPGTRIGDALRAAKAGVADADTRRTYMLFGDPAQRVQPPPAPDIR